MEQFEIVTGTYEEFLLGYKFLLNSESLIQSFASHDHSSSIRSVATSDNYLASGATDDRIIVYDLKTRKEHCMLTHHSSTINCIQFTTKHSHVVSGSADGVLAIVRVGNWQLEKVFENAHSGKAILDIAVHPSGKLALTLGADSSLRTWNLIKGRQAYVINLNSKSKDVKTLEKIIWAEDEIRFILYGGRYTEIWSIELGGVLKTIEHQNKVCSCVWYNDKEIIVGYENGEIARINTETDSKINHEAHQTRVKVLAKYKKWIVSASSSGEIKVWNKHFEEQASANSGCRITCMVIAKILNTKKENQDDTDLLVKDEPVEKKAETGRVVVVEVEESDEEKTIKKKKKTRLHQLPKKQEDNLEANEENNETEKKLSTKEHKKKSKKQKIEHENNEVSNEDSTKYNMEVNNHDDDVAMKKKKKKRKQNTEIDDSSALNEEINTDVPERKKIKKIKKKHKNKN